ncbi:MAG: phosphate ABC transporter ATP-binding protein, partial [Steroidobacteraceae bacterium]
MSVAPKQLDTARQEEGAAAAKIEVRHLNFYYSRTHALKDVSLTLRDRSITAFVGPSGCGKSTLLRVFNRMYALYPGHRAVGEVLLDGQDILAPSMDVADLRLRVGMVFQRPTPFPMSIFDNVAFGLRLARRIGRGDLRE